jgi:DSF synthase
VKRVFNLGGDLELFRTAIQAGNRSRLVAYGQRCIDNLYLWHRNCDLDLTTIALVEGDALGGGFEAALSASVLIAEEGSRLGFPEVLFNLFPGMGAFSFLQRKVGRRIATELITSGDLYTGRQLWEMGVVDVLAPDGEGELALYKFVKKHARNGNGRRGFERGTLEVNVVDRGELERVVEIWADTALRLTDRDLKMMERLVRAQDRINEIIERPNSNIVPIARMAGAD